MKEESALVIYLKFFVLTRQRVRVVKETGIWLLKVGSSPDCIIEQAGISNIVIEIKCPFMGGKPIPYKTVHVNHIPQIILEMVCTSTQQCHYVFWTPVGTKIFLVERDDAYIELLLNYLNKFWNLASRAQYGMKM